MEARVITPEKDYLRDAEVYGMALDPSGRIPDAQFPFFDRDPRPGERYGDFTIASQMQSGMSANLYMVWHHQYWSALVCKMLRAEERHDFKWRQLLRQEGEILLQLNHPGCVRALELNMDAPMPYLLLEYLPGSTVRRILREQGRFSLEDGVRLTMYVAAALVHVHRSGYIHRDIKPSNVMMHDGRVKLIDFGVAWDFTQGELPPDKSGTPMYLAPEQCYQESLTPATDIWQLGVLLHELLTDKLPFPSSDYHNYDAPLHRRYSQLVVPPTTLEEAGVYAPEIQKVIDRCLAFEPGDRYRNVQELLMALDKHVSSKIYPTFSGKKSTLR